MVNNPVYFSKRDIKIYRYKQKTNKKNSRKKLILFIVKYWVVLGDSK
jgi:hypothetical protein